MKKILVALALAASFVLPMVAQEESAEAKEPTKRVWDRGDNISNLSYMSAKILKVYDTKDAYVILYEKQGYNVGKAVVPKSWAHENPRKLEFRTKPPKIESYLTLIKKDGEFHKVVLTMPTARFNSMWGVIMTNKEIEGSDAETLSLKF